ncbi:Solute carrier family 22 member 6-A, partial [Pseudolycoriella hygida]
MSAELIMLPVSGLLSDRFGRRTVLTCNFALTGVLGVLLSFSWNYWMFASLEFLTSLVTSGSYMSIFILGMELVGRKKRAIGSVIISFVFSVGQVLLGLIAMYVKKFRLLLRIIYIPTFLVLSYIWIIPESIRWLLSKGRNEEAVKIIQRAAKVNRVELSHASLQSLKDCSSAALPVEEKGNFLLVLKSRTLTLRLINCCFCWFTNGFVYYGLSVQSVVLGGNKYVNFIMVSVGEIPAVALTYVLLQGVGRKWSLSSSMVLAGIVCLLSELATNAESVSIIRLLLFFIGKCAISVSFYVLYVYTTELYPTFLRQSLMGLCSAFGFIGSMLAPQTPLLTRILPSLTLILFGIVSILSGLLVINFPETFNIKLPDTIEEAENIGKVKEDTKMETKNSINLDSIKLSAEKLNKIVLLKIF